MELYLEYPAEIPGIRESIPIQPNHPIDSLIRRNFEIQKREIATSIFGLLFTDLIVKEQRRRDVMKDIVDIIKRFGRN